MLRVFLVLFALAGETSAGTPAAPRRVGNWDLNARAVFAVAAAPQGRELHFVYAEGSGLHHARSSDGGLTCTTPAFVANGGAPTLAVDRAGIAHLVHEAPGTTRIEYLIIHPG